MRFSAPEKGHSNGLGQNVRREVQSEVRRHELSVGADMAGERLDRALARALPEYSRTRLQGWIRAGQVRVDGEIAQTRAQLSEGQSVVLEAVLEPVIEDAPERIALDIVYEDAALLVVNKPPGLVVHPGAGNRQGTLVNALLHHAPELSHLPRAGLVHRLDKDTSGLLVVAKTTAAHAALVAALERREIHREYLALVRGEIVAGTRIDAPIGRHPSARTRMAVNSRGRPAVTHTRVVERIAGYTLLTVKLETGRTHQIRVHLSHTGTPIVGDGTYGGRQVLTPGLSPAAAEAVRTFPRQVLHAKRLGFVHPVSSEDMSFEAELPADIAALLAVLRESDQQE
ncbi:MAG: 23S rRNA pseudouridine(1911/1915/1917) synthase RluD [Gammaproteobacteria bacterium]